ncbi:protein hydE [Helicobacter bizzozeronii]|nr:protein hydE [Helicobacter bizzozeronii]
MENFVFKFESVGELGIQVGALFMDFLSAHAHAQGLSYAIAPEAFYLQATPEQAQSFADFLSQHLPLALSFKFVGVEVTGETPEFNASPKIAPPIDVLEERHALEQGNLDGIGEVIYEQKPCLDSAEITHAFCGILDRLQQKQHVIVKTSRGIYTLSCTPLENSSVLFMDLASILSLTRLDSRSAQALCTLEKPQLVAVLKEVFVSDFQSLEIYAQLPYDFGLAILAHLGLKRDISYLFMAPNPNTPHLSYTTKAPSFPNQIFSVAKNGLLLPHARTHANPTLEFVRQEAPKEPHLVLYLNFERPTCCWVYDGVYKELLRWQVPTSPSTLLQEVQKNAKGRKLYANYQKAYPELCARLEQSPITEPSRNLLDFLAGLLQVLGMSEAHDPYVLFNQAKSFLRTKGPYVDFKLAKDPPNLNPAPTLRSAMSYVLGGTDAPTMCFGILDSWAQFLGNIIYDTHTQFNLNYVYLCGEVFLQKVFLDLCMEYFPKECAPIFPLKHMDYLA